MSRLFVTRAASFPSALWPQIAAILRLFVTRAASFPSASIIPPQRSDSYEAKFDSGGRHDGSSDTSPAGGAAAA